MRSNFWTHVLRWLFKFRWVSARWGRRRCPTCGDPTMATTEEQEDLGSSKATHSFHLVAQVWRTNPDSIAREQEPYVQETVRKTVPVRSCSRCRSGYLLSIAKVLVTESLLPDGTRKGRFRVEFLGIGGQIVPQLPSIDLSVYFIRQILPSMEELMIVGRLDRTARAAERQ